MSQYQRLFVLADPAMRHDGALQRAAALARASGAALHIAAFIEPFAALALLDPPLQARTRDRAVEAHRKWLEEQAAAPRHQGIQVTLDVVWTPEPLQEILLYVAQMQPDLLIKDVQHQPAFKRAFVTPLDWHLLRQCPVPVHLVSQATHALPRRVLAAVDVARLQHPVAGLNEQIIQAATAMALQCDAELHLLHAYDLSRAYLPNLPGPNVAGTLGWTSDVIDALREELHDSFSELADRFGVPSERRHFIKGPPLAAIAEFVEDRRMDVVVMGTVHRTGLDNLVGSTTEHSLYRLPQSLLAIRPAQALE